MAVSCAVATAVVWTETLAVASTTSTAVTSTMLVAVVNMVEVTVTSSVTLAVAKTVAVAVMVLWENVSLRPVSVEETVAARHNVRSRRDQGHGEVGRAIRSSSDASSNRSSDRCGISTS